VEVAVVGEGGRNTATYITVPTGEVGGGYGTTHVWISDSPEPFAVVTAGIAIVRGLGIVWRRKWAVAFLGRALAAGPRRGGVPANRPCDRT
jgi:hypothetical protein